MQTEKTGFDQGTVRALEKAAADDGKQLTRKFYADNDAVRLRSMPWPDHSIRPETQADADINADQQFENLEKELADKEIVLIHDIAEGMHTGTAPLPELIKILREHVKLFTRPVMRLLDKERTERHTWEQRANSVLQQCERTEVASQQLEKDRTQVIEAMKEAKETIKQQGAYIGELRASIRGKDAQIERMKEAIELKDAALESASKDLVADRKKMFDVRAHSAVPAGMLFVLDTTRQPRPDAAFVHPYIHHFEGGDMSKPIWRETKMPASPTTDYKELWQAEAKIRAKLAAENAQLRGLIETGRLSIEDQRGVIEKKSEVIREQRDAINILDATIAQLRAALEDCELRLRMRSSDLERRIENQGNVIQTQYTELELLRQINRERDDLIEKMIKTHPHYKQKG